MCTYVLTFAEVMKNVVQCVNHIRVRGLYHRQVKAIMEYLNCDYPDVVYFTADRLFSRAATLKGLWNMRLEVKLFMESKQQNVDFLGDENWLNDLAFFSHYTAPVRTELETTMEKSACEHICSLEKNGTVQVPFGRATLANFACLAARKMELFRSRLVEPRWPILHVSRPERWNFLILNPPTMRQVFKSYVMSSQAGFQSSDEIKVKLFAHHFDLSVENSSDDCQIELIELQADMASKRE